MSRISREEVKHIARLARLSLGKAELGAMARDLDQILDYVTALEQLDTDGIEPTAHAIPLETPLRPDTTQAGMASDLAIANAPESAGSSFVVPKVIEGQGEG